MDPNPQLGGRQVIGGKGAKPQIGGGGEGGRGKLSYGGLA